MEEIGDMIVESAKAGDERAFARIFDFYYPEILRFLQSRTAGDTQSIEDPHDVAQIVFVKAARRIRQLRSNDSLRPWLYQIARSSLADSWRSVEKDGRTKARIREECKGVPESPAVIAFHIPSEVAEWVAALGEPFRETVQLIYFEGMTHKEAGEVMGCAPGTISWRISEALKSLREIAVEKLSGES